jgi:hypothetical protein
MQILSLGQSPIFFCIFIILFLCVEVQRTAYENKCSSSFPSKNVTHKQKYPLKNVTHKQKYPLKNVTPTIFRLSETPFKPAAPSISIEKRPRMTDNFGVREKTKND